MQGAFTHHKIGQITVWNRADVDRDPTLLVQQFGPLLGETGGGGIASVVTMLLAAGGRPHRYRHTATIGMHRPLHSADLWVRALGSLVFTRLRHRRVVAHVHMSDGGSLRREGSVAVLAQMLRVPTVVSVHASELDTILAQDRSALLRVLRRVAVVHALGPREEAKLRGALGSNARIVTIPNAVRLHPKETSAGEQAPTVLFAGQVGRRKGVDVLLAAWPSVLGAVPQARLVIVGPAEDVTVPTIVGVTALGPISPEAVGGLLDQARVAVLPSRKEALPMFLIEAMAHARPVVATPVGDVGSLVDGDWIVPVADAEALATALIRLLQDPTLATTVGDRNRSIIAQRFSVEVVHPLFDSLYSSMVS